MSNEETIVILLKIDRGINLAVDRLIRASKTANKQLVIAKDDKVIRVNARDLPG